MALTETLTDTDHEQEMTSEEQEALLLDFAEVVERRKHLAPNGKIYEIRNLEDFGLIEEHELRRDRARFGHLQEADRLSKAQQAEYTALLQDLFARVVIASDDTLASFTDRHKQRVLMFFTAAQLAEEAQMTKGAMSLMRRGNGSTTES